MAKKANGELFGEVGGEERPQKLRWMEGRKCVEGMKKRGGLWPKRRRRPRLAGWGEGRGWMKYISPGQFIFGSEGLSNN
jgi:hypothetical protein